MTRYEISDNIGQILKEAKRGDVSLSEEEIRLRFLYAHGLLFDLTIRQFTILSPWSERTVWRHRHKWGFRKVTGHYITNVANLRTAMSGKGTQGDARIVRNITVKRKKSSSNVAHSHIPAQRGKGD